MNSGEMELIIRRLGQVVLKGVEWLTVAVFAALVIDVLWGVGTRYLLSTQARWSEELARMLLVALTLLGTVLAYVERRHLGLTVLVENLHPNAQKLTGVFVHGLIFVFAAGVLTYGGFELTIQRWGSGQLLPALGISKAWFYLPVPICGLLLSVFSLGAWFHSLRETARHWGIKEDQECTETSTET